MLTSDIAFIRDPVYEKLVQEYASDIESLNRDFAAAWYKLTSQVRSEPLVFQNTTSVVRLVSFKFQLVLSGCTSTTQMADVEPKTYSGLLTVSAHFQDMGPASRCTGPDVPAPAPFQVPLPEPTVPAGADTTAVEMAITQLLRKHQHAVPLIANLGYQCASTFRTTSWVGGCNGGRIRFEPEVRSYAPRFGTWAHNINLHDPNNHAGP